MIKDAVAVVIKRNGKFLLIKRAKKDVAEDYWCPITGAVEQGETQAQAVIREAQEEMGLIVEPVKKVWECYTEDREYLLHWWQVKLLNDTVKINKSEVNFSTKFPSYPSKTRMKLKNARFFQVKIDKNGVKKL